MINKGIFAFGSGRSGTTLLAKLIDSSRQVLYRHEPDKTAPSGDIPFLPESEQYGDYLDLSRDYLAQLFNDKSVFVNGKKPFFDKDFRTPTNQQLLRMLHPVFAIAEKVGVPVSVPDLVKSNDYTILVKSVNSLGRIPLFSRAEPKIKFIHIVRHPGAIIASQLRGIKQNKMGRELFLSSVSKMSNTRFFSIDLDTIAQGSYEEKSAYIWMIQNDKSYRELAESRNYRLISYEDLCVNMNERVESLCEFVGIKFDSQMQSFIKKLTNTSGDSGYFSVMKNPLENIDKWEKSLDDTAVKKIHGIIQQSFIGRFTMDCYDSAKSSTPSELR